MFNKIISLGLLFVLTAPIISARANYNNTIKEESEIRENTRVFVRETTSMALNLRSPTNRINLAVRSADILWKLDESEARGIFGAAIEELKGLMSQVDMDNNQQENLRIAGGANRGNNNLRSKTNFVFKMRSNIAKALANHDPNWALQFLRETNTAFTNPKLIKRVERENKNLEPQIARKIAQKDVTKALELGREKLSNGVNSQVINLLADIYGRDKEKGAEFAVEVLRKLKSMDLKNNQTWMVIRLFQYGLTKPKGNDPPLYDRSSMGELATLMADRLTDSRNRYRNLSSTVMQGLETYAPSKADLVKRTFEQRNANRNSRRGNGSGNRSGVSSVSNDARRKYWQDRAEFQKDINSDVSKLSDNTISPDDRRQIIRDAREKIRTIEGDSSKFSNLLNLATRAGSIGETDLALDILNEAEYFVNQSPKQRRDFSNSRGLANAYAMVDANRSFAIIENMIYRLNSVVNSYVTYMEFTGNRSIVDNDELVLNSRSRQFTNYMNLSPVSLQKLAESDFQRLKSLSDKFDRPEIRVETRLQIAQALMRYVSQSEAASDGVNDEKKAATANGVGR